MHGARAQSVTNGHFLTWLLSLLPGRLPGEHFADDPGDPQRGGDKRSHHHAERDPQLFVHHVRQLGPPVQEGEHGARVRPPQHGQERTPEENAAAETFQSAQNQNPRPDRCECHRQMVTDYIPLLLLSLQCHLLALLCQLKRRCLLTPCCCFWMPVHILNNTLSIPETIFWQQVKTRLWGPLPAVQVTDLWSAARPGRSCNVDGGSTEFLQQWKTSILPATNNRNGWYYCLFIIYIKPHTCVKRPTFTRQDVNNIYDC